MPTHPKRPNRVTVAQALRELEKLWKPPPENDNARVAAGVGESEAGLSNHLTLRRVKPQRSVR